MAPEPAPQQQQQELLLQVPDHNPRSQIVPQSARNGAASANASDAKTLKRKSLWTYVYYTTPVLVILVLFIAHRIISYRHREDVLHTPRIFERWRSQTGSREYYVKEDNQEMGPFPYTFKVEKRNVTWSSKHEGVLEFQYTRKWTYDSEFETLAKLESYKKYEKFFPNLTYVESFGRFQVIGRRSNMNRIYATEPKLPAKDATLGDFYLTQDKIKPYTILLPDFGILLVHDKLSVDETNPSRIILSASWLSNSALVTSELYLESLTPVQRKTVLRIVDGNTTVLRYEDTWNYEQ